MIVELPNSRSSTLAETNVGDQLDANEISWAWYQANFATSVNTTEYSADPRDFGLTGYPDHPQRSCNAFCHLDHGRAGRLHPGGGDMSNWS